jgi:hypothetical protein
MCTKWGKKQARELVPQSTNNPSQPTEQPTYLHFYPIISTVQQQHIDA